MARLEAPVMNTRRRAPAARASSTAYWIRGLSTTGSISFGLALVTGRNRVPRPATGNTALVCFSWGFPGGCGTRQELLQSRFIDDGDFERLRTLELRAGFCTGH